MGIVRWSLWMKNMEKYFKKIRTGRGISLQNETGGHFSQSILSRFENGQSEMSAEKLFDCLENIYLSISEYDYLIKDYINIFSNCFIKYRWILIHISYFI